MKTNKPNLLRVVAYYDPLLQRYARRLTGDAAASAMIVQEVLEEQYDLNGLVPVKYLREGLKTEVRNRCFYRQQSNVAAPPPLKVPFCQNPLIN